MLEAHKEKEAGVEKPRQPYMDPGQGGWSTWDRGLEYLGQGGWSTWDRGVGVSRPNAAESFKLIFSAIRWQVCAVVVVMPTWSSKVKMMKNK